jgi:hypothetical protein
MKAGVLKTYIVKRKVGTHPYNQMPKGQFKKLHENIMAYFNHSVLVVLFTLF